MKNGDIVIRVPIKLVRRNGRKLVFTPDGIAPPRMNPEPDDFIISAILRAHMWNKRLESGKARSIAELARKEGLTDTVVIWPLDLRPGSQSFYIRTITVSFESPLTGDVQVQERDGARWVAQMQFVRGINDARRMDAMIAALRGPVGNIKMVDFRRLKAKGSLAGSPQLVSGTGNTLTLSDFTPNATGVLLMGDLIQTSDGRAHMVVQDIDADEDGNASVPIAPRLREDVVPGDLVTDNCRVLMRLVDDDSGNNATGATLRSTFNLQFMEILPQE